VSDNGLGIPPDDRDKVLRPFYRLEASRATPGNGLGLSTVAAIAKWHDAHVHLGDNAPGLSVTIVFGKKLPPSAPANGPC
jgi:signal transduction histidine kinase